MNTPKSATKHEATIAGTLPTGHLVCSCGRKVHFIAGGKLAHTGGKAVR